MISAALFGTVAEWRRNLAVSAVIGLILGIAGPFGSYLNPSRLTVVSYWVGTMLAGEVIFGFSVRPAVRLAPRLRWPPWIVAVPVTVAAALPLALLCHTVALALWPFLNGRVGLGSFYAQTLLIASLMAVGHALAARRTAAPADAPAPRDFLDRLPRHLGRDVFALQMEDHYVRVHTSAGSALVLIPLRQALEEIGAVEGMQVHRSWWVARHAVAGTVQDGRNVRVRLVNGIEAPVSRARVAEAKEKNVLF